MARNALVHYRYSLFLKAILVKAFNLFCLGRAGTCLGTMAFAGALPVIREEWHIDAAAAGTIQTVFSISNACALFAASWLCDYLGARKVYLIFSWFGVLALLLFACFARSYSSALVMMAFVGLTQGGAYTPAMMLSMGMNSVPKRGLAVGMILAAGSFGYLLSVFISAWGALRWGASFAFSLCAAGALVGAVSGSVALSGYQEDMYRTQKQGGSAKSHVLSVGAILLMVGYIAHCWELLGSWAWTPSLVTNALQAWQMEPMATGLIVACAVHLSGMFSTLIVGAISDYFNRASVLIFMGAAGALSSLLMGLSVSWGAGWTLLFAFMGSFFILGDSGVLSAAIADNVPQAKLGSVMGLRSLLGFGVGSLAPLTFGVVMDSTQSWELAYSVLAAGGTIAFFSACVLRFNCFNANK
ncbi:MFS transporter [Citrobacter sp. FDAARGOS_156]|uniref:MFS transporter n=1 Tax=Citrobacter sp. FDAARGOS_156 TaxID=1702170 RepID=UPI0018FF15D8|nr:MFS transporter [Citrobacter sp. FDAARGOS_156]MBJ8740645.1 MFS transporter [Citrobacter sp. FDAARGOS_156]